jgi:hypothetical protein
VVTGLDFGLNLSAVAITAQLKKFPLISSKT